MSTISNLLSSRAVKVTLRCTSLAALLLLAGCARETLFQSNFDATPVVPPQPPALAQQVGTARTVGSVIVISPPVLPSGKWVQMSRPVPDTGPASFQGNLSTVRGEGRYIFSTIVFMPSDTEVATIQFERLNQPLDDISNFLHLDLMPDNTVRIDHDEGTKFGTFPRDKPFIVQVTLNINALPSAHIVLSGEGASGTADHNIPPASHAMARQFGAVRLEMAFPHLGSLQATIIVVTRRTD